MITLKQSVSYFIYNKVNPSLDTLSLNVNGGLAKTPVSFLRKIDDGRLDNIVVLQVVIFHVNFYWYAQIYHYLFQT